MAKVAEKNKVAKNITYRGKPVVVPAEGKIAYDAAVWQVSDAGDYINTLTGEIREEAGFDWDGAGGSSDGESKNGGEWDEYGQDTGGEIGGAQVKTGGKKK